MSSGGSWRSPSISTTASPPGRVEPGAERRLMAEVPGEPHEPQALVAGREAARRSHEPSVEPSSTMQDLVVAERRESRRETHAKLLDGVELVVDRHTTEITP